MIFPPAWHTLGREAQLAGTQLASGLTILGKANHAQKGLYTQALFALSIGFERLGKLILVTKYAIENKGAWLTDQQLRKKGHDIAGLMDACDPIAKNYVAAKHFGQRPNEQIHRTIIANLTEFANETRYYNLSSLTDAAIGSREPINAWWNNVGQLILDKHYMAKQRAKDEMHAAIMGKMIDESASILHHDETGQPITSYSAMALHAGATSVVQKYGRLYVMQLARWLATTIWELSRHAAYELRYEAFIGLDEPFHIFCCEDHYILNKKTWSIYPWDR